MRNDFKYKKKFGLTFVSLGLLLTLFACSTEVYIEGMKDDSNVSDENSIISIENDETIALEYTDDRVYYESKVKLESDALIDDSKSLEEIIIESINESKQVKFNNNSNKIKETSKSFDEKIVETEEKKETVKNKTEETKASNAKNTSVSNLLSDTVDVTTSIGDDIKKDLLGLEYQVKTASLYDNYKYSDFSVIKFGYAYLYRLLSSNKKNKIVCVNAGHGTPGGSTYKVYSHPDKSPKVSGGTNAMGEVLSMSVSEGTSLKDGRPESEVNLIVAKKLRTKLLKAGYDVLMIREDGDCYLDNIARTVLANNLADIHIAIHFDSTDNDKGIFFIAPSLVTSYLEMEPLKSNYNNIINLGESLISAFKERHDKIFGKGRMNMDLLQLSYSTIPSVDIELGDKATNISDSSLENFAEGLLLGVENYFEKH